MLRFLLTLLLASGAAALHSASQAQASDTRLYEAFGAKPGLAALMNDFVEQLAVDERTKI